MHPLRRPLAPVMLLLAAAAMAAPARIELPDVLISRVADTYGAEAAERARAWGALLDSDPSVHALALLERVNRHFNAMRFVDDIKHWGEEDYWATPLEFLGSGAGDCEDFSIAKYLTLRHLGVPDERLRLVYVKALRLNQAHMVVAYLETPDAEPLLLDNLDPNIRPAGQRTDLLPVYSFNGEGLWLARQRSLGRAAVGSARQVGLWRELEQRMQDGELKRPAGGGSVVDRFRGGGS